MERSKNCKECRGFFVAFRIPHRKSKNKEMEFLHKSGNLTSVKIEVKNLSIFKGEYIIFEQMKGKESELFHQ
jgi:hypothetical protein